MLLTSYSTGTEVQDTGIGIREEDLPKLSAEFERIEEDRNRNIEGTGLGMNMHPLPGSVSLSADFGILCGSLRYRPPLAPWRLGHRIKWTE